jgi:hypothetical protein
MVIRSSFIIYRHGRHIRIPLACYKNIYSSEFNYEENDTPQFAIAYIWTPASSYLEKIVIDMYYF